MNETILMRLGWFTHHDEYASYLTTVETVMSEPTYANRVTQIVNQLNDIDKMISDSRQNSMADMVGDIRVNYSQHIRNLHLDGNNLENELSDIMQLPIRYSRYRQRRSVSRFLGS